VFNGKLRMPADTPAGVPHSHPAVITGIADSAATPDPILEWRKEYVRT
jgi:hypothetical protein